MTLSMIMAVSDNGVIGSGSAIPWQAKGEQLIFKAMTFNQWLIVGRKTFDSMGKLPNRKHAVISRSVAESSDKDVMYFTSIAKAMVFLREVTNHAFVAGGGQIYQGLIGKVDTIHISTIHCIADGEIYAPSIPSDFMPVFEQRFESGIDYTYQIFRR